MKIYHLRRIAALLVVFGLGLLVGGDIGPIIQKHLYSGFYHLALIYDLALEDREIKTKIKTHFDSHQSRSVTNIKFKESSISK
ncbi:hypothetical protein ODV97_18140 [Enterococcus gallinarum]|nr:hypothetical protein [Enterococcus gallinarum]